jgi:hypothetical protein
MDFDGSGGHGRLMAVEFFNGGGDVRWQGGGGKKRHNNKIEATAAAGGNNKHWCSTAEMGNGI